MFDFDAVFSTANETSVDEMEKNDVTRFEYWYPVVESLNIPRPDTLMIDFPRSLVGLAIGEQINDEPITLEEGEKMMQEIVLSIREFGKTHGYPLFLRNSYTSHKHEWDSTCFISEDASDEKITSNIIRIFSFNAFMLPFIAQKLIVRSFIETEPAFTAFDGNTPITEEYRLFYRDGDPLFWQAYWPEDAITNPVPEDGWQDKLENISTPNTVLMERMKYYAEQVTKSLGGFWSVDFLVDKDGYPYLIDMAEGNQSYISEKKIDF